jgi:hypothetical protein
MEWRAKKQWRRLKRFLDPAASPNALVFRSKRNGPLLETTILKQGLYPALKSLDLKQAGLQAFRRGCNRRSFDSRWDIQRLPWRRCTPARFQSNKSKPSFS